MSRLSMEHFSGCSFQAIVTGRLVS